MIALYDKVLGGRVFLDHGVYIFFFCNTYILFCICHALVNEVVCIVYIALSACRPISTRPVHVTGLYTGASFSSDISTFSYKRRFVCSTQEAQVQ